MRWLGYYETDVRQVKCHKNVQRETGAILCRWDVKCSLPCVDGFLDVKHRVPSSPVRACGQYLYVKTLDPSAPAGEQMPSRGNLLAHDSVMNIPDVVALFPIKPFKCLAPYRYDAEETDPGSCDTDMSLYKCCNFLSLHSAIR